MREAAVEQLLVKHAKARRGIAIKLAPTVAGLPDRMVILPGGRIYLVELKAPAGRLSPGQMFVHHKLGQLGVPVHVLKSCTAVDEWFARLD